MQLSLPDEAWEGRLETTNCTIIQHGFAIDFSHFTGHYPFFPAFSSTLLLFFYYADGRKTRAWRIAPCAWASEVVQPCFCLCLGFSQITMTRPLRLMILHFSQMGFTEGLTFICVSSRFLVLRAPCDAAARQVIGGQLNCHLVARQDANVIHAQLTGNMR